MGADDNVCTTCSHLLKHLLVSLSQRRRPLGDNGVWRLVRKLTRKEYAYQNRQGKLKVLNLQRQGITRHGAGYIARWLSVDPIRDKRNRNLVDVERLPTAANRNIFINLEGNPIGYLGVKDLERAVEKARLNGIKVKIVGGGSIVDSSKRGGVTIKLGPIEYTRRAVEMKPWRLPVPMVRKILERITPQSRSRKAVVYFLLGLVFGRLTTYIELPYRVVIVRRQRPLES